MRILSRRIGIISHDLVMVGLAWVFCYLSRYDFAFEMTQTPVFAQSLAIVMIIQGLVLWNTGLYKGVWRFASVSDLWSIIRAAVLGVLFISLALFLANRLEGIPRTSLILYPVILVSMLGGPRLLYRLWTDTRLTLMDVPDRKRVLVLGAGRAGEMLVRDMRRDEAYFPIAFLDDNRKLKGTQVHGLPVFGPIRKLPKVVKKLEIDVVVIALPSATNAEMRRVVEYCEQAGVPFRTMPRLHDFLSGRASYAELRKVVLEDLLSREPVSLDWPLIRQGLRAKTVLISGGGGSIGSELCRQIATIDPTALVILEHSEFNLYKIELELQERFPGINVFTSLADVCDPVAVDHVIRAHRPEVIFHAAAYKHVPLLQGQIREAVRNNILGTRILAKAADRYGVSIFALISTDKAVNPRNVMGAAKRVAEIFCQNFNQYSSTSFITVRFGNVLGSAGSVVPRFREQIANGGPVTVTHPEISRYFMTITEACQLIMQTATAGKGGEIFVLNMGESVKIRYLAEQMILLSGKTPGEDIEIMYTGLRPGEKLYEELFHEAERLASTEHAKILLAQCRKVDWVRFTATLDELAQACDRYDEDALRALLSRLVPEASHTWKVEDSKVIPLSEVRHGQQA